VTLEQISQRLLEIESLAAEEQVDEMQLIISALEELVS
jgi:hypothetical protein